MSKTDKHRPLFVQLADEHNPSWWKEERHDHTKGTCQFTKISDKTVDGRLGRRTYLYLRQLDRGLGCFVWVSSTGWREGMWPKGNGRPRRPAERSSPREAPARAKLRQLRHKWLSTPEVEDIDSREHLPTNRWLWDHTDRWD